MDDDIKALREALEAGPTPGPWAWWTSCSYRRLSSDKTGKDGDVLYAAVHRDGVGDVVGTDATKAYIAAANPDRIARILARLEAAEARLDWLHSGLVSDGFGYWLPEICFQEIAIGVNDAETPPPSRKEVLAFIDQAIAAMQAKEPQP